jgi:hypothetical protein
MQVFGLPRHVSGALAARIAASPQTSRRSAAMQ